MAGIAPLLDVAVVDAKMDPAGGLWRIRWQIANSTRRPQHVSEVWLPHGLFHSERKVLAPTLVLASGESRTITSLVNCSPKPGESIENAFLILRVECGGEWRVFAQVRVDCERQDSLKPVVEKVTAHPVGFMSAENRQRG